MKSMTVFEVKKFLEINKNFKIIDVREVWEHDIGKIEGSIEMPLSTIVPGCYRLDKSIEYGVICHSGVRSLQAGIFLESRGYNVCNVEGGIDKWSLEIDSSIQRY
jgi:rhodanese-related sulfurtransferase